MSSNLKRKCVKCGKTRADNMDVTFHRFPTPGETNMAKASAWAKYCWPNQVFNCEQLKAIHNSSKVLCGRHFKSEDFYDNKRQKLNRFAVPMGHQFLENVPIVVNSNPVDQPSTSHQAILERPVLSVLSENVPNKYHATTKQQPLLRESSEKENIDLCPAEVQPSASHQAAQEHPVLSLLTTNVQDSAQQMDATSARIRKPRSKKRSEVLSKLSVFKLSELSSREQKLYKICRNKIREIGRLRKKIKNQRGIISNISEDENVKKLCEMKLSSSFTLLLQSQLKNCQKKPKGRRYTLQQKIMALVLFKKSAACYRLLRRMFTLPCQSSLTKLLNRVPLQPGINEHIFSTLQLMAKKQREEDNMCILSFDEMAIRKHIWYDPKVDQINGFQDHGNHGRNNQIATKALVFMLSGIRKKWKQPIAFYFSSTINADRMTVIVKEVLTECLKAQLNVVATVCDLSTVNIKVLKTLGATTREPYFSHDGQEIVAVLDPPHLLKCTRNLFMKHEVECDTDIQCQDKPIKGIAKWSDIVNFYQIDKNSPNFVLAPALTDHHCNPNLKQQMRVKLAAQVFSHSVAAGILTKCATNELPASASTTASFIKKFDDLFDAVNANTPDLRRGKKYSTNLTNRSPHMELFQKMRKFISSMKYIGSKNNPPSQEGWIHTLNGIERLWKNIQDKVKSLETRRLNQDPLENFFGCIRYSCGSNDNPTINQFVAGVKTAIITNLRHSGRNKNCEDDTFSLSNNLTSFLTAELPASKAMEGNADFNYLELETIIADAVERVDMATPEIQACGYVSGFIFKKLKYNDCPECRNAFLSQSKEAIHIFTTFKEYRSSDSLMYVSENFILCVEIMATIVNKFLDTDAWRPTLKKRVMSKFESVDLSFLNICADHSDINKFFIKNSVFLICIKRYTILKNREIDQTEKNKALHRKLNILQNK